MPEQLRAAMESTGYWGAVRVVPQDTEGGELLVRGTIIVSDGEQLELEITALDATGREWFNRGYEEEVEVARQPGGRQKGAECRSHPERPPEANQRPVSTLHSQRIPKNKPFHHVLIRQVTSPLLEVVINQLFIIAHGYKHPIDRQ